MAKLFMVEDPARQELTEARRALELRLGKTWKTVGDARSRGQLKMMCRCMMVYPVEVQKG